MCYTVNDRYSRQQTAERGAKMETAMMDDDLWSVVGLAIFVDGDYLDAVCKCNECMYGGVEYPLWSTVGTACCS